MTATAPTTDDQPDVERDKARLAELGVLIPAVNADRDALYAERLSIWQRLRRAGVDRKEMARLAGTSVDMVKLALSPKRKRVSPAE